MEKSYSKGNRKKAVVISDDGLLFTVISEALEAENYFVTRFEPETEEMDLRSRLIVMVIRVIDEHVMKALKSISRMSIKVPTLGVFTDDKKVTVQHIKNLQLTAAVSERDNIERLRWAIVGAESGEQYISDKFKESDQKDFLKTLTKRQYEIFMLITIGRSVEDIASELGISEKTVRNQLSNINRLLGTSNLYQATIKYFESKQ